jgi:hypothetical protein
MAYPFRSKEKLYKYSRHIDTPRHLVPPLAYQKVYVCPIIIIPTVPRRSMTVCLICISLFAKRQTNRGTQDAQKVGSGVQKIELGAKEVGYLVVI